MTPGLRPRPLLATVAAASALALTAAAPAAGAVRIGPDEIVLDGGRKSGRAVIELAPFALRIENDGGRTVLTSAAGSAGPVLVPPAADQLPGGVPLAPGATLYSPLSVLVGVAPTVQFPAGPWVANVLTGTAAGIAYGSTDVLAGRRSSRSVTIEIGTTDPGGRVIELTLRARDRGIQSRARVTPEAGVAGMSASFTSPREEAFRGFGGRHNEIDQRGQDLLGWVQQQNVGAGVAQPAVDLLPGAGGDRYLFPNGPTAAYYVAPSFISSRGYGYLLERDELSRWRMGSDRADSWQVQVAAPRLDQLIVQGGARRAIARLTRVTGRQPQPPAWALGPLIDRSTIAFTQTADGYVEQVEDDLRELSARDIDITGYRIEGWDKLERDRLRPLIDELTARRIHPLAYFRAFVSLDGAGTENPDVTNEALANGYLVRNAAGLPYLFGGNFLGPSALIDFTNPAAVAWWKGRIKEALDLGFDGFMQDFGEQVLGDMRFHDGSTGATMHNRYPVLFHRITREAVSEWEADNRRRGPVWFFTRTGFTGRDGSARFEGGNFAGDGNTDFSRSSGLASQAPDMLNRGIAGAYGFTTDIGGYFDFVSPPTTKELFIRWAQWATLSPVMRVHGSINAGTHVPWSYDEETVAEYKRLAALRLQARPLLRRLWAEARRTGMPIARPLWLAEPRTPGADDADQDWMLGEDVLVAPVVSEGERVRSVGFPPGCWRHGETGRRFRGPTRAQVPAPLFSLPWFERCGTRIGKG